MRVPMAKYRVLLKDYATTPSLRTSPCRGTAIHG
jgi:hypothetical protein